MKLFHITFIFLCAMLTMGKIQPVVPTEAEEREEGERQFQLGMEQALERVQEIGRLIAALQQPVIAQPPAQQIMPEMEQPGLANAGQVIQLAALPNVHIHNLLPPAHVIPMEQPQVAIPLAQIRANGIRRNASERCGQVLDCHCQACECVGPFTAIYPFCWGPVLTTIQSPCITAYVCCNIKAAKKGIFYCWNDEY